MLWNFNNTQSKIDLAITKWLNEGQELLVLFYKINEMQPFTDDCLETKAEVLQQFHQTLTDYLSCGNLEIFQDLTKENAKFSINNVTPDAVVIAQIQKNTDEIMDLITTNEKGEKTSWKILKHNLDPLGELIASRIVLEDKLINEYIAGKTKQNSHLKSGSSKSI